VKHSLVVEADGGPLGVTLAGVNVHGTTRLAATLEAIVVERPQPTEETPQHLCLNKGDDHPTSPDTVAAFRYASHIRRMGEETLNPHGQKTYPARRWVVERPLAWLSKCRSLLVEDEKNAINSLRLLQLTCTLLWMRRRSRLIAD
jgi:putative transposase